MKALLFHAAVVFLSIALMPASTFADWTVLTPGIDYQQFAASGPNNVFVTRMDRSDTTCTIDSCIAQGKLVSGRQPVSGMANLYNDAIGYWGQSWGGRYEVVAAINGDGFSSDQPTNGQIIAGWYAKRFNEFSGGGLVWTLNRGIFIAECVHHISAKNILTYPGTGATQEFDGINGAPGSNDIVQYTPQWDARTPSTPVAAEVVVDVSQPNLIKPVPNYAAGTVTAIKQNSGSTPIQFDQFVLSANGSAATKLLANVTIGSQVRLSQEITHYDKSCAVGASGDFTKTYSCIGYMTFVFLRNGVIDPNSSNGGAVRQPRTAVAYNNDYIYFVVVDGRSGISVGMTMQELGDFCVNNLSATWGLNQDGGGSSDLWADGSVRNSPSDGSERYVTNGLMMIKVHPKETSSTLSAGTAVNTGSAQNLYAGPGTNYGALSSVGSGAAGTVLANAVNGVYAKSDHWWKCAFGAATGWIRESVLVTPTSTPAPTPTFTPVSNASNWIEYR